MYYDPYTLFIFPGDCGAAKGELYLDDEHTLAHETGQFALRKFVFDGKEIRSSLSRSEFQPVSNVHSLNSDPSFSVMNTVERIVLAGQNRAPTKVLVRAAVGTEPIELKFSFDHDAHMVTIKKPDVRVMDDWAISLEY